jgi:apolipoprotein D and lipocalin family protein
MKSSSFVISVLVVAAVAAAQNRAPLTVVPSVELNRYAGTWYEVARLPNPFQKDCAGEVTATYRLLDDGALEVVNTCRSADGSMKQAIGRARKASADGPDAKLEVRFAPAFLSFLPFVWGNYWIIDLASDYSYAVVGEPDRAYLWILARQPELSDSTMQEILARTRGQGYDLTNLLFTKQHSTRVEENDDNNGVNNGVQ